MNTLELELNALLKGNKKTTNSISWSKGDPDWESKLSKWQK